jgi:phage/plasmid-associated DNA primase
MHSSEAVSSVRLTQLADPTVPVRLIGRSVNISEEDSRRNPSAEAHLPHILGGGLLLLGHCRTRSAVPLFVRFVVSANELPSALAKSSPLGRQLIVLPCRSPVDEGHSAELLLHHLLAERPGILRRWQAAARRLFQRGHLLEPAASHWAIQRHFNSQDVIGHILREVIDFPDADSEHAQAFTSEVDLVWA